MKQITFTMSDDRGTTTIRENFDEDATWMAIAYSFHKFLQSMGYNLDTDAVGADVDDYLTSAPDEGEDW